MSEAPVQIFVSYSHADREKVLREVEWLRTQAFQPWYDRSIRAGEAWRDELAEAISGSGVFLFFVTPRSVASEHCRKEVSYALERGLPVLAVHLEPSELPPGLGLALSDIQAILKHELPASRYGEILPNTLRRLASGEELAPAAATAPAVAVSAPSEPIVAVLPFVNVGGDKSQEYVSDGIAEEVLSGLAKQPGLKVIARTSAFRFKRKDLDALEIAAKVGASHVVEGTVRMSGDRIRVSAELIDASDATLLWSEQYRRDVEDLFAVQDEITEEILAALKVHITRPSKLDNRAISVAAYDSYLQARHHYHRLDFERAAEHAQNAISADPSYASAYTLLAGMHALKVWYWESSMHEELPRIRHYASFASQLEPNMVRSRELEVLLDFFVEHRFAQAYREAHDLLVQHPRDRNLLETFASFKMALRDFDGCIEAYDRLLELDPMSTYQHRLKAERMVLAGRYDEARVTLDHTGTMGMPDPMQYGYLAFMQGDADALEAQLEPLAKRMGPEHLFTKIAHARHLFLREDLDAARALLAPLRARAEQQNFQYMLAQICQLTGDPEGFLDHLEQALQIGEFTAYQNYTLGGIWAERYPQLASGERYASILAGLGLDDAAIAGYALPTDLPRG